MLDAAKMEGLKANLEAAINRKQLKETALSSARDAMAVAESDLQANERNRMQNEQVLHPLRDKLEQGLHALEESYVNGSREHRLPHVCNISFKYVEGEGLMMGFNKNIALSSGSACTSASLEPSYVLKALGLGDDLAHSSLRFGLSRFTTEEEIDYTIKAITDTVLKLREMSPLWEMYKEGIDLNTIEWAAH